MNNEKAVALILQPDVYSIETIFLASKVLFSLCIRRQNVELSHALDLWINMRPVLFLQTAFFSNRIRKSSPNYLLLISVSADYSPIALYTQDMY